MNYQTGIKTAAIGLSLCLFGTIAHAADSFRGFVAGMSVDDFRQTATSAGMNIGDPRSTRHRGQPITRITVQSPEDRRLRISGNIAEGSDRIFMIVVNDEIGTNLYEEMTGESRRPTITYEREDWEDDGLKYNWGSGQRSGNRPQRLSITAPDLEPK